MSHHPGHRPCDSQFLLQQRKMQSFLLASILALSITVSLVQADCNNVQGPCNKGNIQANGCSLVNSYTDEQVEEFCDQAA